ncbi:MAG: hypothetical protein VX278_00195 [Myxococcota bacterium]|nr:hypothetical protein [Myxococcota bacterium]
MYRYLCLGLLVFTLSGCAGGQKKLSLENLLPKQLESVPIGMSLSDFEQQNKLEDFEKTNITKDIFYLKKTYESDVLFVQYQFKNGQVAEVIIGYEKNFAAEDVANKLYGSADDAGRWQAQSNGQNVIIQIFDNTIIYR